jgi:hypothetical protein
MMHLAYLEAPPIGLASTTALPSSGDLSIQPTSSKAAIISEGDLPCLPISAGDLCPLPTGLVSITLLPSSGDSSVQPAFL